MEKSLFEYMPSKALVGLVAANGIKDKEFSNPEWYGAYKEFQKASGYKDIDVDKFKTYVKFYSRLGRQTMDRTEVAKDGAVTATVTRMMHSDFQKKSISDYREKMMGLHYGNR
jgi:hypothetical protein